MMVLLTNLFKSLTNVYCNLPFCEIRDFPWNLQSHTVNKQVVPFYRGCCTAAGGLRNVGKQCLAHAQGFDRLFIVYFSQSPHFQGQYQAV